jgi:hypothetical protein
MRLDLPTAASQFPTSETPGVDISARLKPKPKQAKEKPSGAEKKNSIIASPQLRRSATAPANNNPAAVSYIPNIRGASGGGVCFGGNLPTSSRGYSSRASRSWLEIKDEKRDRAALHAETS